MMKKRERLNSDISLGDLDIDAFMGEGTSFEGKFSFKGVVRIDGTVKGELGCDGTLIVGESGTLTASVVTEDAVIRGSIKGDIDARGRVELRNPCTIEGDIRAGMLHVEEGVSISGTVTCGKFTSDGKSSSLESAAFLGDIDEELAEEIE